MLSTFMYVLLSLWVHFRPIKVALIFVCFVLNMYYGRLDLTTGAMWCIDLIVLLFS